MLPARLTLRLSSLQSWHISRLTEQFGGLLTRFEAAYQPLPDAQSRSMAAMPLSSRESLADYRRSYQSFELASDMSASPFRQYTTSQQVNGKLEQTRAGKAQQATGKPKSKLPFGGTRRGTPPKPHAGGPTPEVAAAQSWPAQVVRTGRVKGKYNIKRKQVFAVVELGPTQFKVMSSSWLPLTSVPAVHTALQTIMLP